MTTLLHDGHISMSIALFLVAAGLVGYFGIKMTYLARDIAMATGLGEAFTGAVFIGGTTSLSGIIASATAAWHGEASLAVSNSLGGIAAQTLFLVLADLLYRKSNLEFAAASVENLMMSVQLMLLLCILMIAFNLPDVSVFSIHPASFLLIATYLFSVKLLVDAHEKPMWLPRQVPGTIGESTRHPKDERASMTGAKLFLYFAVCASVVSAAGWIMATSGMVIAQTTGISAGIMGGIFIAVATSLPELVVAVTAVRLGALTLAVGDIVGGNAFDTLFIAVSDAFYREGSIYAAIAQTEKIWLGSAMLMNSVLLMGLMYRERKGIANIGMESAVIAVIYLLTILYLAS